MWEKDKISRKAQAKPKLLLYIVILCLSYRPAVGKLKVIYCALQ